MSKPKSRRIPKPFWFGIAAVLMVVLAVFLQVWLPYHREQVAIREIERLGGEVETYWHGPDWIADGPEWIQEKVNDGWLSWFDRVYWVRLEGTSISNEGMIHVRSLTKLEYLWLFHTHISNNGLKHLSDLNSLGGLWLDNTQVTDEGVEELQKALPNCHIHR